MWDCDSRASSIVLSSLMIAQSLVIFSHVVKTTQRLCFFSHNQIKNFARYASFLVRIALFMAGLSRYNVVSSTKSTVKTNINDVCRITNEQQVFLKLNRSPCSICSHAFCKVYHRKVFPIWQGRFNFSYFDL